MICIRFTSSPLHCIHQRFGSNYRMKLNSKRLLSLLHLLAHFSSLAGVYAEAMNFPSEANSTTLWTNNYVYSRWVYSDNTYIRPVLALSTNGYLDFGFGFLSNGTADIFYLAVVKIPKQILSDHGFPPVILWCANRNRPVRTNATLEFKANGDLVLTDFDGTVAWTSKTNNSNATNMSLDGDGNLRIQQSNGSTLWSSFDNPTDTWAARQTLRVNQKLISSVSDTNLSTGMYYANIDSKDIRTFVDWSGSCRGYGKLSFMRTSSRTFSHGLLNVTGDEVTFQSEGDKFMYIRMDPDGHLGVYELQDEDGSSRLVTNLVTGRKYGECGYPNVCGSYGVCSNLGGNCGCPGENGTYFKQVNPSDVHSGCTEVNRLTCTDTNLHGFVELKKVTYFHLYPALVNVDAMACKRECMMNCSCKAAFFRYYDNASVGNCSLEFQQILSLIDTDKSSFGYVDLVFIKVQNRSSSPTKPWVVALVWAAALLVTILFLAFVSGSFQFYRQRIKKRMIQLPNDDESVVDLPNQLTKFSFEDLKSATEGFRSKLGQGGFGSVYEGTLERCGTKIAVKHLIASIHQCKGSFVAEVKTIGGIHHINLVRLVGYCVEGSNRLLVYEYMSNGSLDSWIFRHERATNLNWETRWKIIVGIAKGLEYLHDFCNKNIIHFDIKPQNILLDKDFNVKIADFGLARLFDKDKSHVSTLPKGTLGYMAPELIKGKEEITVKIDIYSFGIVILEINCGRRNSDCSYDTSLVEIVKAKAEEDRLADLVDRRADDDMKKSFNRDEAVETLRIAISCLQPVSTRPTASMVVKMLEGLVVVEPFADYSFLDPFQSSFTPRHDFEGSPPPSNSVLSCPR